MIKKLSPYLFILFVTCLIFFKIFTRGLYPIPADLLVSFYFPWYSGGWDGYNSFTVHKEMLNADSIRQIYPWKQFAAQEFKNGNIPLWNPYTFSGQPLAANLQSGIYYPFNIFYFLTDPKNAWIILVVIQPLLAGIFTYMALSSFKLKRISALFGASAFIFSSYVVTWIENVNIIHSYIWLPLAIWTINRFEQSKKYRYFLILILALTFSILAGHPQTAIYVFIATFIYWMYKLKKNLVVKIAIISFCFAAALLISSIQLIPTAAFYKVSPVSLPFSKEVFDWSILPYRNLITFFASDFFGHAATDNFWSKSYGDFTPYIGVIPLFFALWILTRHFKENIIKFSAFVSAFFVLAAINSPITYLIKTLQIPLLDSTTPSRFISISIFFLIIMSAYGFEDFIENFQDKKYWRQFLKFTFFFLCIYIALWAFALFGKSFLEPQEIWAKNLAVTRRNLILPTFMFLSVPIGAMATLVLERKLNLGSKLAKTIVILGIFTVFLLGGVYYSNKFLPVAPKKFIFPNHLIFNWLLENAGIDRFYGAGTAHIDFSFPIVYEVYGSEGYDTLRYERYAELLASSFTGHVPETYLRSDAVFPTDENGYRKRLLDLLGVKYFLDKNDEPKSDADWHYERFDKDQVFGIWQQGKFQVYQRRTVLPRVFLSSNYIVASNDNEIIDKIYDEKFDLKTLILEKEPSIKIENSESGIILPEIISYESGEVSIKTASDTNALLFLSDVYDKDWNVTTDGQKSELLRTDYALRSVAVPGGEHIITFKYQPRSFKQGAIITSVSLFALSLLSIYWVKKKKF
ncbi:MAG: YfhO family protein [Candidatus Curtissbacteria bacterium]|nr:YfhO family protein [Candidatus Curtissbacteria bacterium]